MRHASLGLTIFLLVLSVGTAGGDDDTIARELADKLGTARSRGTLQDFEIGVKVENGIVWMKGSVKDKAQRDLALDTARRVSGVRLVVNDLTMGEQPTDLSWKGGPFPPAMGVVEPPTRTDLLAGPRSAAGSIFPVWQTSNGRPAGVPANMGGMQSALSIPMVPGRASCAIAARPRAAATSARGPVAYGRHPVPVRRGRPIRLIGFTPPVAEGCVGGECPGSGCALDGVLGPPNASYVGDESFDGYYGSAGMCEGGSCYSDAGIGDGYHGAGHADGYYGAEIPYGGGYALTPPAPTYASGVPLGYGGAVYDQPQLPGYAWPSYAAYPNYAAVAYPRQYSPAAWPYIGPFYPYPQVPLGWRKVMLEWDDGWWMLDFQAK
jgi:hypothetical protein